MDGTELSIWIALTAGVLSFFSPCVLPLIPSYLTYISGLSLQELKEEGERPGIRLSAAIHALIFVLGFSTIFIALGAIAGLASFSFQSFFREGLGWIQKVGGVLIILFGLHITGFVTFKFMHAYKRVEVSKKPVGLFGSYLVGLAFAAGWTPCIGPILGSILALVAGTSGSAGKGILLLAFYSAGLGIPFVLAAVLFQRFLSAFNTFKKQIRLMEIIAGLLMIGVGILILTDSFARISSFLYQYIPVVG